MAELSLIAAFFSLPLWGQIIIGVAAGPVVVASAWGVLCKNAAMIRATFRGIIAGYDKFKKWRISPSMATQLASMQADMISMKRKMYDLSDEPQNKQAPSSTFEPNNRRTPVQ